MVFCSKEFIGKKIKEFRKKAKLTQAQLAEHVGLSETHMSKIEIGANSPTVENFLKIIEALNIPINEFGINIEQKKSETREKFLKFIFENSETNLEFYYNLLTKIDKFKSGY